MFLPVRADFPLTRFPAVTVLVCLVCLGVFLKQESDWSKFENAIARYCDGDRSRISKIVLQRVDAYKQASICGASPASSEHPAGRRQYATAGRTGHLEIVFRCVPVA